MCDCGFPFDAAGSATALAAGFKPHHELHPPGPSKGAKFAAGLAGYLLGYLPLGIMAEIEDRLDQGDLDLIPNLLRGLGLLTGIVGVWIALRLLKRWHARRSETPSRTKDSSGAIRRR